MTENSDGRPSVRPAGRGDRFALTRPVLPEPGRRGALLVMVGAPGTGKSYLARHLAERFDAVLLRTDVVRKELFPEPSYSSEEVRAVYVESHARIRAALAAGRVAIFDATNLEEKHRATLYRLGEEAGAPVVVIRAYAPAEEIQARVGRRASAPHPLDQSDADWLVSRQLQQRARPILYPHLVVNTVVSFAPTTAIVGRLIGATPARTAGS